MLIGMTEVYAQKDYTSSITNPSFEFDFNGWEHKGMGRQDNSVFSIKDGSFYVEKWTGRGGAVGTGSVTQTLSTLPPGNYELKAAAQNIQEDTPNSKQTGAWIFAGDKKTTVTVRDTYQVLFDHVAGNVTIGFEAKDASGNWIAVDNFRLTQVGTDLSAPLNAAIAHAVTTYGDGTGKKADQLKTAIDAANVVAQDDNATGQQQADAIIALEQAEQVFLLANADSEHPMDMTSCLVNPSFETGDFTGWTASNMSLQNNSIFSIKKGTWFVEKWTGRGGAVGNAQLEQVVSDMPAGTYRLTVAAQNIQEDTPNNSQTGAWIYASNQQMSIDVRKDYTLEFVLVSNQLRMGFLAKNASGNWLAVDNFRLEYISDDFEAIKAGFESLISKAEQIAGQRMNTATAQTLQAAIDAAKQLVTETTTEGWGEAARQLEAAYAKAVESQEAFALLAQAITNAQQELDLSAATDKTILQQAIETALAVYNATETTNDMAHAAIEALQKAIFEFKIATGSENGPTVVTDPRFIRGCTWAFGRSTVTGSDIMEQGFCWAEHPDPKVTDSRTTEYLNQAGRIYWLRNLKPATIYYMRAYAINKDYGVGYGNVIKFVTVPKGTVGHWYNNGGDEATNDRLNYAINTAIDYYWNNLTSIHDFGISVNYSPGTPTADCSYGGWMRVGESSSYQQPGTIMHEAFHGIGVGTHGMWWNGEMRSAGNRGDWLGDRVTEAVRFWDNSATAVITGDDMHLWPYGCNGAHEDTHSDNLYCMMGILAQALNEDGLPASDNIGYALPYYAFNHEDGVKYYLKNEDKSRGLNTSYLVENASHQLEWKAMTAEEALADDHAAWYLSFTPANQYYQLRNAATGYYITYASGFKTAWHATPTSADDLHLMRGRVDIDGHRGYYIIHPQSNTATPSLLNALTNGKTGQANFNIAKSATTQRWLILTADDALNFDNGNILLARTELADLLARIRQLAATPHSEAIEGADATLTNTLNAIETEADACTKGSEISALTVMARNAAVDFLSSVWATDESMPFNLTFMLENPDFDNDVTTGWTSTNGNPGYDAQGAEFYEKTFNYYQVLDNMPKGQYQLRANAFQRPGSYESVLAPYTNGTSKVTSALYINSTAEPICHICDDRQPTPLFNDGGWGSDSQLTDGTYIPNCMIGAEKYFVQGLYDSSVSALLDNKGGSLRVGIKCTSAPSYYWTMFDHFRLLFFGQEAEPSGISSPTADAQPAPSRDIYDLSGRKVTGPLSKGIYLMGRKKVIISNYLQYEEDL